MRQGRRRRRRPLKTTTAEAASENAATTAKSRKSADGDGGTADVAAIGGTAKAESERNESGPVLLRRIPTMSLRIHFSGFDWSNSSSSNCRGRLRVSLNLFMNMSTSRPSTLSPLLCFPFHSADLTSKFKLALVFYYERSNFLEKTKRK